ncbi:MAG: DUF115 domain-containing protein, partial [Chitinivibrionales bacterium]|nr:DUF115 domain-containing protein [Chitinivibrionales bacterium]
LMDPTCVVVRDGWLQALHEARQQSDAPVLGRHKKVMRQEQPVINGWSRFAWYDSCALRRLNLETYFEKRIDNPWWKYRNEIDPRTLNLAFTGPHFSAFDTMFEHLLYALCCMDATGAADPLEWQSCAAGTDCPLIVSGNPYELDGTKITEKTVMVYTVVTRSIGYMMMRQHLRNAGIKKAVRAGQTPPTVKNYPLSGPRYNLIGDNSRLLDIDMLKDMFVGERCFIIGNGPSLKKTDMRPLKNEYTFGLNRIYLNYENMEFEPTFLCVANRNVAEQFHIDLDQLNSVKFIDYPLRPFISNRWNTFFLESYGFHDFNTDLGDLRWCQGVTVTYCAMQVAFYLGFDEVILIGVDHSFSKAGRPHQLVTEQERDDNHFHPDYFGKGVKWQYPDLKRSEVSYQVAKDTYEKHGRRIYDATVGGKLTVFPKVAYDTLFERSTAAVR